MGTHGAGEIRGDWLLRAEALTWGQLLAGRTRAQSRRRQGADCTLQPAEVIEPKEGPVW